MHRNVKDKELSNMQKLILSMNTCQWWNTVFIQKNRFFDIMEKHHGGTPWDINDTISNFTADRFFLILSLYNAIECLQKMDIELQRENDKTFETVLKEIEKAANLDDIKNLRDMNEHYLDYLVDLGQKQDQFRTAYKKDGRDILTTAAWTQIDSNADMILLGNVEINKLLRVMEKQLPIVRSKTREIYDMAMRSDDD